MKKLLSILLITLISTSPLHAQTGDAAAAAAKAPQETIWQDWTFAAVTMVVAGTAIYYIAVNNGHPAR